jgi:DNA modification methylase
MNDRIRDSRLTVVRRAIADLHLDPSNARTHDKKNLGAIRSSLEHFGQVEPVVVQKSSGRVIGGNGRVAVLREMGATEVDVVEVDIDDVNATALGIALNRTAELADWDEDVLGQLLATLDAAPDFDATLSGFSAAEIERMLGSTAGLCDADEIPEPPPEPITQPGDLWLLGEHRLICGDSTDAAVVARVLDGAVPRLLLTDPPYGVSYDARWRDRAGLNACGPAEAPYMQRAEGHTNTTISGDTRADWSEAFELVPSLDTAYVWHASAHAHEVALGLLRIGYSISQQICWRKPHFALSRQHYHWQHEPAFYARKKNALPFRGSRDQSTVWDAASPKMIMNPAGEREAKVDHPTQKPAVLYTRPIENHLERGDCFYEAFAGSGTALVAAEQTERRCLAVELDAKYIDVVVARFEKFSGKKAERRPS